MPPRETYLSSGPTRTGDAELVALVLGTGLPGKSALCLASDVLQRFGDLRGVATASVHELCDIKGLGPARAVRLHAALHAGRRSLVQADLGAPVRGPTEAFAILSPVLQGLVDEELHALFLDHRRQLLAHRALTRGSDAFTVVDPRQVFRLAVGCRASAIILAHNHPSGDPTPSRQDEEVTRRVVRAGRTLGIPLLDHLVVAGPRYVSLAQAGGVPELGEWAADPACTR